MSDPQADYESEQAALRDQYGEEPEEQAGSGQIAYDAPEVNPEIWRDLDAVLFRGFTYQSCLIGDVIFTFKSLNQHEFERLSLATRLLPESKASKLRYANLLAFGVWMVDGENVLADRETNLSELRSLFLAMPNSVQSVIARHMSELNRRANRAVQLTEAYVYEQSSRFRWLQTYGLSPCSPDVTGVKGTEQIGLNWGQLAWRALNRLEDQRLEGEASWENAKFIASAMAGSKGISKINSADKTRRRGEREERIARRDRLIRQTLFGEEGVKEGQQAIQVARTVEELADQLERDLRGEKDWHDQVVDAYQQRIAEAEQARQDRLTEIKASHANDFGGRALAGATDYRGMSKDDVERLLLEKRRAAVEAMQSSDLPMSARSPEEADRADRWLNALPLGTPSKEPR